MRRLLIIAAAALAGTLATAGVGTAADVVRFQKIDVAFDEPFLRVDITDVCGFPVYVQGEGFLNVTLQYDAAGRLLRETYSTPGAFVTYSAPTEGTSYRFPWLPREEFVYPGGATIGGPVLYRQTGMIVNHRGLPAESGVVALEGIVVAFTADGAPLVDFTDDQIADVFARGSITRASDFATRAEATCTALAAN